MTDYGINRDGGFPIRESLSDEDAYEGYRSLWNLAGAQIEEAQREVEKWAKERERIVLDLQARGLGFRRIAAVLGVTHHQQVDQIARRA